MVKRLSDDHPTKKKLDDLMALIEASGIAFQFLGHRTLVLDIGTGEEFDLEDLDDSSPIDQLPCAFECKLVRDR